LHPKSVIYILGFPTRTKQVNLNHYVTRLAIHAQVDVAIIEVGLGGKLDSTNVVMHLIGYSCCSYI